MKVDEKIVAKFIQKDLERKEADQLFDKLIQDEGLKEVLLRTLAEVKGK